MRGGDIYAVRHHYRYVYSAPVSDIHQRLIMIPPDLHLDQALLSHTLDVRGAAGQVSIAWEPDLFGNRVCRVDVGRVEHAIDFEVEYVVRHVASQDAARDTLDPARLEAYLSFTALTAPDARIHTAALEIASAASDAGRCAEMANEWAAGAITYQIGVTGTQTPAACSRCHAPPQDRAT